MDVRVDLGRRNHVLGNFNRIVHAGALLVAFATAAAFSPGCAMIDKGAAWWHSHYPPAVDPATPPTPQPVAYVVERDKRIEKVARSVEFDITPALDGTQEVEPVPVWLYAGTDPAAWNGGNHTSSGLLSVRVKANNTTSYELKVGPTPAGVQEPDVQAPCRAGVKVHMRLELLDNGVRFTAGDGKPAFVAVDTAGDHTIGIGWPPQKRQGMLGAKYENIVWSGP